MSRCITVLLLPGLLLVGCSRPSSPGVVKTLASSKPDEADMDYEIREAVRHNNLTIFPIVSRVPRTEDRFTTLDEGLRERTVEVFEIGSETAHHAGLERSSDLNDPFGDLFEESVVHADSFGSDSGPPMDTSANDGLTAERHSLTWSGPEVNRVMVINRSDKPLYLMPGEIIMGGEQDRCVAEEFVLQPSEMAVPVEVFCVEHGRWGGRASADTARYVHSALAVAEESVGVANGVDFDRMAVQANRGQFVASVGALNAKTRLSVQADKDQSSVWKSVASVNSDYGVDTESGAFTGNYVDAGSLVRIEPYHDALSDKVRDTRDIVGVLVAVNGRVQAMDLFESTPLFRKLWPKLLKSYALDAAHTADDADAMVVCTADAAAAFFQESMQGDIEDSEVKRGIAMTRRSSEHVLTFAAEDNVSGGGFGGGGFGGVHTSAFSR